jgi:hypothetical protein
MQETAPKTIRISKMLLTSISISLLSTAAVGIILGLTFRPYRYSGKAEDIYRQLTAPDKFVRTFRDYDHTGTIYRDKNGVQLSDSAADALYYEECEAADSAAKIEWENNRRKSLTFGGVEEFFRYCGDDNGAVTWNPTEIESSIRSRQEYLVTKIRTILLIVLPTSLAICYLILYARKKRIKILIN